MSNRNKRKRTPTSSPKPVQETPSPSVVSLRLPHRLSVNGKSCSEAMGISFNALVCVALTEYLQAKGYSLAGKL